MEIGDAERTAPAERYDLGKIAHALQRTGFLLEHDVYAYLRDKGSNVFLNSLYLDGDTKVYREIDVTTRDRLDLWGKPSDASQITFWRSIVIECKNYDAPLVAIGRSRAQTRMTRTFSEIRASRPVQSTRGPKSKDSLGIALNIRSLPASAENASFVGSQIVRLEHKSNGYTATTADLMQSLFLPVAKAMWTEQQELTRDRSQADSSLPMHVVLSFPLVVTRRPVFEADVTGGLPMIREVPWTTVLRRFHRNAEDDSILPESLLLEIVSRDGLSEYFANRVEAFTVQVCGALENGAELWKPTPRS